MGNEALENHQHLQFVSFSISDMRCFRFKLTKLALLLVAILTSCSSDTYSRPPLPYLQGAWQDSFVAFDDCRRTPYTMVLDIEQVEGSTELRGQSVLTNYFTGEETRGVFLGSIDVRVQPRAVVGTLTYAFAEGSKPFDVAFSYDPDDNTVGGWLKHGQGAGCDGSSPLGLRALPTLVKEVGDERAQEGNAQPATAPSLLESATYKGLAVGPGDVDWFKLELNQFELIKLRLLSDSTSVRGTIYGETGQVLEVDDANFYTSDELYTSLGRGTYYIIIDDFMSREAEYALAFERGTPPDAMNEPNDEPAEATPMSVGADGIAQQGYLAPDDEDWYSLTLEETSTLVIDDQDFGPYIRLHYYDQDEFKRIYDEADIFDPGTYYVKVYDTGYSSNAADNFYTLSATTALVPDDTLEPNNEEAQAVSFAPGETVAGFIRVEDEDWFSFSLDNAQTLDVAFNSRTKGLRGSVKFDVLDRRGELVESYEVGAAGGTFSYLPLSSGHYFVRVSCTGWGKYDFTLSSR